MKIQIVTPLFALAYIILGLQGVQAESAVASVDQDGITTVEIANVDELMQLFDRLNYNKESWEKGYREIPRLIFEKVHEGWRHTSPKLPVQLKKAIFFRLMAPLVLMSNENIRLTRQKILNSDLDDPQLVELAKKYRIKISAKKAFTEQHRQLLLKRVDTLPPSLVLAQAAEESGWGTSRFVIEGNSFFGQWDFSDDAMRPGEQRTELGNYGIARFDTPLDSVEGYMLNINSHPAYKKLRDLRLQLRRENKPVTGLALVSTLDKYSERGQAYVDGLREMINYNRLDLVDDAYLSHTQVIRLVKVDK